MQKRFYSARRINVTEKPARLSGFSSLQSSSSQPEQNETDEPPSLFKPLNACISLYGLSQKNTRPLRFVITRPLLFPSKTHGQKGKDLFFAGLLSELTKKSIPCGLTLLMRTNNWSGILQKEGFIVRDNSGRIKTIIFGKKRSR